MALCDTAQLFLLSTLLPSISGLF
ncbi:sortase B protein-sorting domain-containing protein [Leminorella grimontii]